MTGKCFEHRRQWIEDRILELADCDTLIDSDHSLLDDSFDADVSDCGNILPAGDSCDVVVTFEPIELGSAEAVLLVSADGDAFADLNLSGVGTSEPGPPDDPIFDDRFEQAKR